MKKWYVFNRSAEGEAVFFVELTPNELQIICNFLDQQCNGPDEGYSGGMELLYSKGFNSKEEAEQYVWDDGEWPWTLDDDEESYE